MTLETGALLGMAIGMSGMIGMAGFAYWSKRQEDKAKKYLLEHSSNESQINNESGSFKN